MDNKSDTKNTLYFYNTAKEFFSNIDLSKSSMLVNLINHAISNTKVLVIHNVTDYLDVYDETGVTQVQMSDLVDALPLLFQSYSFSKIVVDDIKLINNKLNLSTEDYQDGGCFAIDINNQSLWFVFLKPDDLLSENEIKIISDIYLFLEDLVNFSINVTQGETLAEKLRHEKKKHNIWLESLAWLNDLGNKEYSDVELEELYKSALFQLKMVVRADYAVAFKVDNEGAFTSLVNYGDTDISAEIKTILSEKNIIDQSESTASNIVSSSEHSSLKNTNIQSLNFYPLYFQKKLKLVLVVCLEDSVFDEHENMIATLFSEGLEHIIVRMYFLRAMRHQNAFLKKEKLEQQILISKLRDAQEQILQNEKMASIGQLAAGVAHEINNPVGYVNSNINSLDGYITDIYDILDLYQTLEGDLPEDNQHRLEVKELKADIDFNFIREDIKELISESKEGVLRVKQIVKDLKDFSHVDEAEWQLTNLEKGIDSTLNIVHNELKYKAKIYKEYGKIPEIECVPSQINQIMMNLLVNAGHAIDDQGSITIKTGILNETHIFVDIIDTGKGIAPENLTKIFDPFFTTKPVGQGTGLGLSLSYSIAEKHGGELSVKSVVGEGTTFRLALPIKKVDGDEQVVT